jgi:hypothetical protein
MSKIGNNVASRVTEFMNILSKYDVAHVFGHYLNVAVELEKGVVVSEEDKLRLNAISAFNDLKTNIWQLYYC